MDRIYDYNSGRLYVEYKNSVTFDLSIRTPITQVYGESATGKTLLVNCIENIIKNNKFNSEIDLDVSNIKIFSEEFVRVEDLSILRNCLVIIDRADLILQSRGTRIINKDVIDFIQSDRINHYLIFGRLAFDLGLSPNYYGEFVTDNNKCITIDYKFSEVGWF